MLTVSDRLPEHRLTACASLGATNAPKTINHASHEGKWQVVSVGPIDVTVVGPTEIAESGRLGSEVADRAAALVAHRKSGV
ncbi:thioredoxin domain-containing protein [Micromonospora tarensis]|uniref:Uncharacterized protein n=1 Tax=Micromonospora tarensis TaxID=2806100 RepID=A0ABS1YN40_9ACTN|nr:hypothetical protein [Micromonospora tarensis]MBM0278727.1 hypothetical protein [Micromonospora tarensis]